MAKAPADNTPPDPVPRPIVRDRIRFAAKLVVIVVLLFAAWQISVVVRDYVGMKLTPESIGMLRGMVAVSLVALIVLMAVPFVPGAEIGFLLLTTLGGQVAPWVWLATVVSLSLAFAVGRLVPARVTCAWLRSLNLKRAADLVETLDTEGPKREVLLSSVRTGPYRALARHRYISLGLALNMPGNVVLGGGGGLALAAGMSRAFPPPAFLLTVGIAVLPVPLFFYIADM